MDIQHPDITKMEQKGHLIDEEVVGYDHEYNKVYKGDLYYDINGVFVRHDALHDFAINTLGAVLKKA